MPAQLSRDDPPQAPGPGPVTTVITLFRRAAVLMIEDLVGRLQAAGFPDVSASFHPVFENIDPGGTRLTTLAARAGMTHQSMGEVVDALRERGYVERRPDPSDGRARLVCLTEEGRRLARRALREIAAIEDEWRSHFAEAGLDRDLRSVLQDAVRRPAAGRP